MLPGAQKKSEKNSCSRFPSVFLILVFSLFLIFFVFVYSLVAPSEKKIGSAPAERSSDRRKDSFGTRFGNRAFVLRSRVTFRLL